MSQGLQRLVRPPIYQGGKRPSFQAAYARAARRYKFDIGVFPTFAYKNHTVFRIASIDDIEGGTEVPAESIQNDLEYVVPVTIGTPGVEMLLDFDTGSSDLWVWSTQTANVKRSNHVTLYDPTHSSTAKKQNSTWKIQYGDGSRALGVVYTDRVTIGDVTIPNQAVEVATQLSQQFFSNGDSDGLLGLAWPQINTVKPHPVATPVQNMIAENLISPPVFTCKLERADASPKDANAGFYSFGYIDETVTSDPITYTPVNNSNGFWQVPSESYSINGRVIERSGNTTILDTGTTLALVDDTILSEIYGAIPGAVFDSRQGGWKYPQHAHVPEIAFAVGDQLYKINSKDIGYGDPFGGYRFGSIQSRGNLTFDIFGDAFLKSVYVVFNQGESTVGLAQRDD